MRSAAGKAHIPTSRLVREHEQSLQPARDGGSWCIEGWEDRRGFR